MVIFLVGYMGCGKSTIGRALSKRLGWAFADMDSCIEQQAGMSIADIFKNKGEREFRRMEREFLEQGIANESDIIVSTGGGAPCQGDNMEFMNRTGQTVYLKMSPDKLVQRLSARGREKRPLIRDMDDGQLLEFIKCNIVLREPFYSQARLVIDCDGVSDEYIARHIESYVELIKH